MFGKNLEIFGKKLEKFGKNLQKNLESQIFSLKNGLNKTLTQ